MVHNGHCCYVGTRPLLNNLLTKMNIHYTSSTPHVLLTSTQPHKPKKSTFPDSIKTSLDIVPRISQALPGSSSDRTRLAIKIQQDRHPCSSRMSPEDFSRRGIHVPLPPNLTPSRPKPLLRRLHQNVSRDAVHTAINPLAR